jgi:hypothetical protein
MTVSAQDQEELLPEELERELELSLRAAWSPGAIDPARHEALLELALEDPLAPASAEELVESDRLRRALEGDGNHPHLGLARALAAASRPALPERALPVPEVPPAPARGRVVYVAFGAASAVFAAAAAVALLVGGLRRSEPQAASAPALIAPAALATSRSSSALFQEPFTLEGTTARIDRITSARERELRQNRYLAWGVR